MATVHVDQAWVDEALGAVVYRLRVVEGPSTSRTLQKRFSDFHALHSHLALREGASELQRLGMPPFPRKKLIGNRDTGLIESRRDTFERCHSSSSIRRCHAYRTFIGQRISKGLRVEYSKSELCLEESPGYIQYTFDVFLDGRPVDSFTERYRRAADRFSELSKLGYLDHFSPALEFPPPQHTKNVMSDPSLVKQRGQALQQYYHRLLSEADDELFLIVGNDKLARLIDERHSPAETGLSEAGDASATAASANSASPRQMEEEIAPVPQPVTSSLAPSVDTERGDSRATEADVDADKKDAVGLASTGAVAMGICAGAGLFMRAQTAIGAVLALAASIIVAVACRRLVLPSPRAARR